MNERLTLATSTGLPFLFLAFHFGTGLVAIVAGFAALAVRKGARWHRQAGLVFTYAMIATGVTATGISLYEDGKSSPLSGLMIVYFVLTALATVKPLPGFGKPMSLAFMAVAFAFGATSYASGFTALGRPGNQIDGVPAGMMFFMGTIYLLAAIGDGRMIYAGGIQGARRLARHLWRMCYALFVATGSFFIGQMKIMPEPLKNLPLMITLGVSPLVILLYWMWRVRFRRNLKGMMTAKPVEA